MKKLRSVLTVVMAAMLAATLLIASACSGGGSKKEIVVMTWHGPYDSTQYYQGYKYLEEEYEKEHSDVDIVLRSEPDSQYSQILETGFSGGTAPDVILMKSAQRSTYLSDLLDLTPYFLEKSAYSDSDRWIDDFIGGMNSFKLENSGSDDEAALGYMFVPFDSNPNFTEETMFIFNTKQVAEAGLDPNDAPETYEEFFTWMEALRVDFPDGIIAGNSDVGTKLSHIHFEFGNHYFDSFFDEKYSTDDVSDALFWDKTYIVLTYSQEGFEDELDAAGRQVPISGGPMAIDSAPYNDAMTEFGRHYLEQYREGWISTSDTDASLLFTRGDVPMYTVTPNTYDTLLSDVASMGGDKFNQGENATGMFPVPYLDAATLDYAVEKGWITQAQADSAEPWIAGKYSSVTGGQFDFGFTVNRKVGENQEKLDIVIDFLQFATSKDIQEEYVVKANSISPIDGVPIPESVSRFSSPEPEDGYATQLVGGYAFEWGLGPDDNWSVTTYDYMLGENKHGYKNATELITALSDPLWYGDILLLSAYKDAMDTKQAEYDATTDEAMKQIKELELKIATYRYELYKDYYYEKTGPLTSK